MLRNYHHILLARLVFMITEHPKNGDFYGGGQFLDKKACLFWRALVNNIPA
jgi:hypothetical protein